MDNTPKTCILHSGSLPEATDSRPRAPGLTFFTATPKLSHLKSQDSLPLQANEWFYTQINLKPIVYADVQESFGLEIERLRDQEVYLLISFKNYCSQIKLSLIRPFQQDVGVQPGRL